MSDDRELVELLAGIDATPRAVWVAGLRADLDSAWEIEDPGYLDSLPWTTVAVVDHEPTQPTSGHRWPILIAAAAAVLLVGVLVVYDGDRVTPADEPSPGVTVAPTTPPLAWPNKFGPLVPGTYYVDEGDGTPTPRIFATFGAGWWADSSPLRWRLDKRDSDASFPSLVELHQHEIGTMGFSQPAAVFLDACHTNDPSYHRGPVTTLDGLVAALTEQKGWADVTAPTDISVDGYAGKEFQRTAPADMSDCDLMNWGSRVRQGLQPVFVSWDVSEADRFSGSGPYEPGQIETLWVIDIDGTLVVINTRPFPEPSAGAPADFAADVLDSIRIDRP